MIGGQLAMLAIGQGATEITPMQMAQAMSVIGNGGKLYQSRLVQQVQDITGEVTSAYSVRVRRQVEIPPATLAALRSGMTQVVTGSRGTAHQAKVDKVTVAGKTGTAQWRNNATVAWFAGFAPAEGPRLAFAVVYEGDPNRNDVHGGSHAAPMIGKVLREYFKDPAKAKPVRQLDENGNEDRPAGTHSGARSPSVQSNVLEADLRLTNLPRGKPMKNAPSPSPSSDAIIVRGLELTACIGVPDTERAEAQRLTVDLVLLPAGSLSNLDDDLARTVDYYLLTRRVRQVAVARPRKLIETLAEEICECVLAGFAVRRVELELRKYILPDTEYVAVRMCREAAGE
jgi:dihydroneopterin aldolase